MARLVHTTMNRTGVLVRINRLRPIRRKELPVIPTSASSPMPRTLLVAGLAALLAAPVMMAAPSQARADVTVRASGSVRIGTPRVRVRVRARPGPVIVRDHRVVVTPRPRHRLHVSGGVYVGGSVYVGPTYAEPPPPPPSYDCDVPAYYTPSHPVPVVVAPAYEPMGPRFGLGLFAGGVKTEHAEGDDLGLTARYRLTRGLALEGELSRVREDDSGDETRRLGGALIWDLSSRSRLSPHLLGGIGSWDQRGYAELGVGLTYRLSPRFHLAADIRAGAVDAAEDQPDVLRSQVVGTPDDTVEPESYSRGRLSAIIYF